MAKIQVQGVLWDTKAVWMEDMITGHSYGTSPSIFSSCTSVFILKQSGVSACRCWKHEGAFTCRMDPVITGAVLKHQCGAGSKNPSPSMRRGDGDALLQPCGEQHWAFCAATQEGNSASFWTKGTLRARKQFALVSLPSKIFIAKGRKKKNPKIIFPFFWVNRWGVAGQLTILIKSGAMYRCKAFTTYAAFSACSHEGSASIFPASLKLPLCLQRCPSLTSRCSVRGVPTPSSCPCFLILS